jgi:muramoyltetrapeptide carboxypeptidase
VEDFKTPPLLKPGDKIAIVAPARKIDRAPIERSVAILQEWGLQVVLSENLFTSKHSYLSGTDDERLRDLQNALDDPSIKTILCGRGGYGSSRIVDQLDLSAITVKPKWLVGFSDITSLHMRFLSERIMCIHGTMPVLFPKTESTVSVESLRKLLFNGVAAMNAEANSGNRFGESHGVVVGGNLSLIVDSLGTSSEISTSNKILVIEEIDEFYYKIDRMMTQLKRAGKLSNLAGLVVGHMTDIKNGELTFANSVEEIIQNAVSGYNFPVAFNFPSGHENPNLAWIQGGSASLTVGENGSSLRFSPIKPYF